jgi:predicted metalloprotease
MVAVALLLVAALLSGCTRTIGGKPSAAPSNFDSELQGPPARMQGGASSPTDVLAANVVTGVESFWRTAFPVAFGRPWPNIHGYYAVDPKTTQSPPPCLRRSLNIDGQALYCPEMDTIAWDQVGLLPRLVNSYGPGAAVVALAHEMGHAVQNRLGINATAQLREKERYPTILLEGMADCYAGSAMHAVVAGQVPNVTVSRPDLDRALRALLSFRDPTSAIGTKPVAAHGNAFDRASAFIDGYSGGPATCAGMTVGNQNFTQRSYGSIADEISGGNLSLPDLERFLGADATAWFGQLITARGGRWRAPSLGAGPRGSCATPDTAGQGPASFCPASDTLTVSSRDLGDVHDSLGDYASGAVLVSRYALAALAALGRPVRGADASHAVLCLTGAYTRSVFDRNGAFKLSPGDIDEAVNELLDQNFAAREVAGGTAPGDMGFERVEQFRAGVLGGPDKCGI